MNPRQEYIRSILENTDYNKIKGAYASSLVKNLDKHFIKYLSGIVDIELISDPNSSAVLELIGDEGWRFYNRYYLGNPV